MTACAIVLGAALRPDGTPSPTLRLRVLHAAGLWHTGRVAHVVTTGGGTPSEGGVARALLLDEGLPPDAVTAETTSTSTLANIAHAIPLLPVGTTRAVIVSNRWHLPRARMIARLLGLAATGSGPRGAAPAAWTARMAAREAAATPLAAWRALRWARRSGR